MKDEVLFKSSAYKTLAADVRKGQLSHAYLLISADGVARRAFYEAATRLILCDRCGCGYCSTCLQVDAGTHPDVRDFSGRYTVADMEELTEDTELRPVESGRKVYFLDGAEKLRADAQNKLLKTYEEPPAYITIILGTAKESTILNTIRSRAKKLYIGPFDNEDVENELEERGLGRSEAQAVSAFAQGSFETAEKMADDEKFREIFDKTLNMVFELKSSKQMAPYLMSDLFAKENIAVTLDVMEIAYSDLLAAVLSVKTEKRIKGRDFDFASLAKEFTPQSLSMVNKAIADAREKLFFNINSVTVAEGMLFQIMEAKYKWQR